MLKLCDRLFMEGDVLKIERMDDKVMVVCIERVFGDDEFQCWDIFERVSWEGAPAMAMPRMHAKEVRAVSKLGTISDANKMWCVKFMLMYQQVKEWEKALS